jgi:DNA-binding NarL/FixJ family response regulator
MGAIEAGEAVLVVEDEPVERSLIVEVLEELGYRALQAADGPSGLKILQSRVRIDRLITDVSLPEINGSNSPTRPANGVRSCKCSSSQDMPRTPPWPMASWMRAWQ